MNKVSRLVVAAILVVISCISLASCGDGSLSGDPAVGEWTLSEAEYNDTTISAEQLKEFGNMDEMPTFNISENGSCSFTFGGATGEGKISAEGDGEYSVNDMSEEDSSLSLKLDGEKLKLDYTDMDMVLVFTK